MDDVCSVPGLSPRTSASSSPYRVEEGRRKRFRPSPPETSSPNLEIEIDTGKVTIVCRVKGSLDATTITTFRGAVGLSLGEQGVIIDLSGVHGLDGTGLTALARAVGRAREQRTRVALVVPPGNVRKLLHDAGLDLIVSVSDTVDLARAEIDDNDRTVDRQEAW